jgi:hypothetical protein
MSKNFALRICTPGLVVAGSFLFLTLGCGGKDPPTPSMTNQTPPANLTYPQTSINATVGVAIPVDTPTIVGSASSYTVSPTLPSGLSISSSSGTISGKPTATSAATAYSVTASNSAGSTKTSVQIAVGPAVTPPSNLVYPQTSISIEAGQPFVTDIPTVSGTVTAYSVSPALPAGLTLDPNTGAVYGSPSTSSASNTYTVTATNAGGNTTASLTLVVNPALVTLLDLGAGAGIGKILSVGSNVLIQDGSGHWVLIDYSSGTKLASGEAGNYVPGIPWPIYIAGATLAVGVANGVEIRSSATGSLQAIIASPTIDVPATGGFEQGAGWRLASDGSYICAGSVTGLTAWSSSGSVLLSLNGEYDGVNMFAAPGQIQIALGPSGNNVIQTVLTANGSSSVGPAFSGTFNTWSLDGTFFLTNLSNTVWTYNAASSQTGSLTIPNFGTLNGLGGEGSWVWAISSTGTQSVVIYPVGGSTAAASYAIGPSDELIPYGNTLAILAYGAPAVTVVDLSGTNPVATNHALTTEYNLAYAAFSSSQWLVGNVHGVVIDGASLTSTPRYLALGKPFSIAGSNSIVAIALDSGTVYTFSPTSTTPQEAISFLSSQVQLSSDGTVLAVAADSADDQYHSDETLSIYALPAGTVINSWPYQLGGTQLLSFSLAASGSNIGQVTSNSSTLLREVTAVTGGPVIWSDTPSIFSPPPPALSPDGTLIAAANDTRTSSAATTIYLNGIAVKAVPGFAVGWINDSKVVGS